MAKNKDCRKGSGFFIDQSEFFKVLLCKGSHKSQHSDGYSSPTAERKGRWWVGEERGRQYIPCSSSSLALGSSACILVALIQLLT